MVPDPLPLAYTVYAFINVDNCERPLRVSVVGKFRVRIRVVNMFGVMVRVNTTQNLDPSP